MSAMQAGATWRNKCSQIRSSLTQSSILNVKEGLVNVKHVQSIISMLTTTSTSYILLASLDVARKRLATEGKVLIEQTIQLAEHVRDAINAIEHLYCPGKKCGTDATFNYDPTKIIVSVKDLGITGHQAEVWLREHYNIEVELSDLYNILCLITFGDTESETNTLITALQDLAQHLVIGQIKVFKYK